MNLIGYDLYSDLDCFLSDSFGESSVSNVSIGPGTYDLIKMTKNTSEYEDPESLDVWDQDSVFLSDFENKDFVGGNLSYFIKDIVSIRLKRREIGKFNWTGIYKHDVSEPGDTTFTYIDPYARGRKTVYEYCIAPIFRDGTERNYNIVEVESDFDGAIIADKDRVLHVELEPQISQTTRNKTTSVITTINNKYPFVFYGGNANYTSGSFSGVIIKNEDDIFDFDHSTEYRQEIVDWLTNGNPKILKMYDGRIWMISVSGNVQCDYSQHYDKVVVSFEFVEVGDVSSTDDMYNNNFTDYVI